MIRAGLWTSFSPTISNGVVVLFMGAALPLGPVLAMDFQENVGFSPNHVYESGVFGENVDVTTGNLTLTVPIGPTYQLNTLSYGVVLTYNSKIWKYTDAQATTEATRYPYLKTDSQFGVGWTYHEGRIFLPPGADWPVPEKIVYENPTGGRHELFPDDPTSPSPYYYSKDSSYLRARAYDNMYNEPAKIWKLWEPDGTSRVMGYLVGDGKVGRRTKLSPPPIYPADLLNGWYTIRLESARQYPLSSNNYGCNNEPQARLVGGIQAELNGVLVDEVPCSYVEIFYVGSLASGETPYQSHEVQTGQGPRVVFDYHSDPLVSCCPRIVYLRDSLGRVTEFDSSTDEIRLPGFNGTQMIYRLERSYFRISSPSGTNTGLLDPNGICHSDVDIPSDPTEVRVDELNRVVDPLGNVLSFNYHEPDCSNHGNIMARTLPTGARFEYEYGIYPYRGNDKSFSVTRRRLLVGGQKTAEWFYSRDPLQTTPFGGVPGFDSLNFSNPPTTWVVDPDGNMTVYKLRYDLLLDDPYPDPPSQGLVLMVERRKDGGTGANIVSREEYAYEKDLFDYPVDEAPSSSNQNQTVLWSANNRRMETKRTVFLSDGTLLTVKTRKSEYEGYGRYKKTSEYQLGSDASVYRTTEHSYGLTSSYLDRWILYNNNTTTTVRSGVTGPILSKREALYDDWGTLYLTEDFPDPSSTMFITTSHSLNDLGAITQTRVNESTSGPQWTTTLDRDGAGHLLSKQFGSLPWKAFDRDVDFNTGWVTATRSPAGVETRYQYDSLGRLTLIDPPGTEQDTTIEYPTLQLTIVKQGGLADRIESQYHYDQAGRLILQDRRNKDGAFDSKETRYDAMGRKVFESEWVSAGTPQPWPGTTFEYWVPKVGPAGPADLSLGPESYVADPLGRVTRVTAADGAVTETSYDDLHTTVTQPDRNRVPGSGFPPHSSTLSTTTFTRDAFGRLIHVDALAGEDATYTYDVLDQLTRVAMGVQTREFTYDGVGRLTRSVNPENGLVTFEDYDARGLLLKKTDAAQVQTVLEYDEAGRVVRETRGNTGQVLKEFTYDTPLGGATDKAAGHLVRVETYTELDHLFDPNEPNPVEVKRELFYEELNGRLSKEEVSFGQSTAGPFTTVYSYDTMGLLSGVTYPGGTARGVVYDYVNGVLKAVGDLTNAQAYVSDITYNPAGGKRLVRYGNLTQTEVIPDLRNRPAEIIVRALGQMAALEGPAGEIEGHPAVAAWEPPAWMSRWMSQRPLARPDLEKEGPARLPPDLIAQSVIDPLCCDGGGGGTLFDVWDSGPYSYDGAGNIIAIGTDTFTYDPLNRLTDAVVGNLTDYGNSTDQYTLTYS